MVTYRRVKVRIIGVFLSWAVIFDTTTNAFCVLRERGWKVNVDSSAAGQKATADASDRAPGTDPVLAPTANTVVNAPGNQFTGPVGAATTRFTK